MVSFFRSTSNLYQFSPIQTKLLLFFLALLKASTAIYRSVVGRLEGDLRLSTAVCAYSSEVLARSSACVLLSVAASLASLRLVQKAFFSVESLLTGSEYELVAAILANKSLVYVLFFFYCYCFVVFVLEHLLEPLFVKKYELCICPLADSDRHL